LDNSSHKLDNNADPLVLIRKSNSGTEFTKVNSLPCAPIID